MRSMKTLTGIAGLALAAGTLVGCGGDAETDAYCDRLEQDAQFFEELDSGEVDPAQFGEIFERFGALAEQAPEEVEADWAVIDEGFTTLEQAFEEAGLTPEDLGALSQGQLPEGVDPEQLQEAVAGLEEAASGLESEDFEQAGDNIQAHAEEECGIELGDSGESEDSGN